MVTLPIIINPVSLTIHISLATLLTAWLIVPRILNNEHENEVFIQGKVIKIGWLMKGLLFIAVPVYGSILGVNLMLPSLLLDNYIANRKTL